MSQNLPFELEKTVDGSKARATRFTTLHGSVTTPMFMPVGTLATVRAQSFESLEAAGTQVMLANTYHLLNRPGLGIFRQFGGIHRFSSWKGPVLTDSGGFQIFSLPGFRKMEEEGASFESLIDGAKIQLTPELSIQAQKAIGSDIMMVLDECVPSTSDFNTAQSAVERTFRWAKRSQAAQGDSRQALFGIIQGACFEELRRRSADQITSLNLDGYAIGGLAVGETKSQREDFTEMTTQYMPADKPRYLMGVGTPIDLLEAIHRGVDMFDCILPAALAQQGVTYTSKGKVELRRTAFANVDQPLDVNCACGTCQRYSRGYLHHLVKTKEVTGWTLLGQHNLFFYLDFMRRTRAAVLENRFLDFYRHWREVLDQSDPDFPKITQKIRHPRRRFEKELGDYAVAENDAGSFSIIQKSSGQKMHSVSDPFVEAQTLYVEQSNVLKKLEHSDQTVWDVGLGAGTNAMALILHAERAGFKNQATLKVISFERDLDPFRLAIKYRALFPHLRHRAPEILLQEGVWKSKAFPIEWRLLVGDFAETYREAETPQTLFYDPFSPKVDSPLWSYSFFKALYSKLTHSAGEVAPSGALFTYSNSTAVRAGLLAAGFSVGPGVATPPKDETTIAYWGAPTGKLFGTEWLERFGRSDAQRPLGVLDSEWSEAYQSIIGHPQFSVMAKADSKESELLNS